MTDKLLIDRELLEQVACELEHDNDRYMLGRELRKVLAAPQPSAVPEGWSARLIKDGDSTGYVVSTPRDEAGVRSNTSVWADDDDPAHAMLWYMLAASPSAQATVQGVNQKLLEALEELMYAHTDKAEALATAALAAPVRGEADYDSELHAAWLCRMKELCKEYRQADDGADVRDAWINLMSHLDCQPASMVSLTDGELRVGVAIQRAEIDRLRQQLRDEGDRIAELRAALETIYPYIKDKKVTGRKPLKDGIYTLHIGQIVREALGAQPASATPRQPEGDDGWLVSLELPEVQCNCAWNPDSHDKTCPVYLRDRMADAQRAIAELREECSFLKDCQENAMLHMTGLVAERDTLRQQLAEARDEITQHSNDLALAYMKGGADMRQQRDRLAKLLREALPYANYCEDNGRLFRDIQAALAEVK